MCFKVDADLQLFVCLCKDHKMYGGSFLYHIGGGQPLVSIGFVVSYYLFFIDFLEIC